MLDFCITDIPCTSNELRTFTMRDLSLKKILRFSKYFKKVKYDIIYIYDYQEEFIYFGNYFLCFLIRYAKRNHLR